MVPDDPLGDFASLDDISQAIEDLSPEELFQLHRAARYCLLGSEYLDADELINEAICRTMSAAEGGEGRRWPRGVPFMSYMVMTMKGLASDSRESASKTRTRRLEAMAPPAGTIEDVLGGLGHHHPDGLALMLETERHDLARERVQEIEDHFAADEQVSWVLQGRKDGLSAQEIQQLGEMNQTQYDTACRRLRRGLGKMFPGRGKP